MGRMTSLLWKTKIHVPNHQPDNKHRNTLAENDFYTILDKRVALRGLRNMLAEYMALKMEKKKFFSPKIVISTSGFGGSPQLGRQFSRPESPGSDSQPVVFFGKSHGFGIMLTGCAFVSHTGLLKYSIWLQVCLSWTHEPISGESRNFRWIPPSFDLYRSC